jgi:hypothetical protein
MLNNEKCVGQTFDGRKKERRRRIKRNGANTICLPYFVTMPLIKKKIDVENN